MVGYAFHFKNSKRSMEEKIEGSKRMRPRWLDLFLSKRFFGICEEHKETRKSEINIYCIDCNLCMCSHCLAQDLSHRCHRSLQIRRYVYQDVVRIHDMQKLIDCSKIQPYTVNKAKVLLLNARKQFKPSKSSLGGASCKVCRRSIFEPNRYCSIACKVSDEAVVETTAPHSKSGPFIAPLTPDLEDLAPAEDDSACSLSSASHPSDSAEENPGRPMEEEEEEEPEASPPKRISRRKGRPHRAPFF